MRLKKLASGVALLGLSAGFGVTALAASPASATTIRPYILNAIGLGSTDANVWDNQACLIGDAGTGDHGRVNGVVSAPTNQKDVNFNSIVGASIGPQVPVCVPVGISLTGSATVIPGTKPGGTLAVTTQADLQGGVEASSQTTVDVTYSAGQVVTTPSGAAILSGTGNNPAGGTVRFLLKASTVKSKVALTTSCHDVIKVIDTNPTSPATLNADGSPLATDWDNTSHPALTASQYMATIRECASSDAPVSGKPVTTKIAVAHDGAVSATFIEAQTINPQTWDTTAGTSCSGVKTAATGPSFGGTALLESRVIQCKGAYGAPVQFALDVRAFGTNGGEDPYGLAHPATIALGGGTFSN